MGLVEYRPATGSTRFHRCDPEQRTNLPSDNVYRIERASEGRLWLATFGGGVARFDPESGLVDLSLGTRDGLSDAQAWSVFEDDEGMVWIGTQVGLDRHDPETGQWQHYAHDPEKSETLGGRVVTSMRQDTAGALWVTSFDGTASLSRLSPDRSRFRRYGPSTGLSQRGARGVFEDASGLFWVVTMGGLANSDPNRIGFHLTELGSGLLPILEDSDRTIWLGTIGGLRRYSREDNGVERVSEPRLARALVTALEEDPEGRLWIGLYGGDLVLFDRTSNRILETFTHDPEDAESLPDSNCIRRIRMDRAEPGTLWIATQGGGIARMQIATGAFETYAHDPDDPGSLSNDTASYGALMQDPDGTLWVGTDAGLNRLRPGSKRFERFDRGAGDGDLASGVIQALHRDRQGCLWIATANGLHRFVDGAPPRFERFGVADGLADDMVIGILEYQDQLWLSSPSGLTKFDPTGALPAEVYGRSEGLKTDSFLLTSFYKTRDGEFWFGGGRGVSHFQPATVRSNGYRPPVVLTSLTQNGIPVQGPDPGHLRDVVLEWPRNHFEFEASALSYSMPGLNRYRYRLEGLDTEWYTSDSGSGRYAALPGGEYLLRVQGASSSGVWNDDGVSVRLRVEPPPWKRRWFLTASMLIATVLLAGVMFQVELLWKEVRQRRAAEQARDHVEAELREAARVEALGRLASGVAHDFNNLLTVFAGGVELIRGKLGDQAEALALEQEFRMLETATTKGADLTRHLLAFGASRALPPTQIDLNSVVEGARLVLDRVLGEDVATEYALDTEVGGVLAAPGRLEQLLLNLIVNARHAMPDGGTVHVAVEQRFVDQIRTDALGQEIHPGPYALLRVRDSGSGMDESTAQRVFDPYFTTKREGRGTGLGLAIVREILLECGGFIEVTSSPGVGTQFTTLFPALEREAPAAGPEPRGVTRPEVAGVVLLIEDEDDVREVLRSALSDAGYEVLAVRDAEQAFREWDRDPDAFSAVVTDVVMPGLNGDAIVNQLRLSRPDLPVLFLSGYTPKRIRLEPLGTGAWSVLNKPIYPSALSEALARVMAGKSDGELADRLPLTP